MGVGVRENYYEELDQDVSRAFTASGKMTRTGRRMVRARGPFIKPFVAFLLTLALWSGWSFLWFDLWALPESYYEEPSVLLGAGSVVLWLCGGLLLARRLWESVDVARHNRRVRLQELSDWRGRTAESRVAAFAEARKQDQRAEKIASGARVAGKVLRFGFKSTLNLSGLDFDRDGS